VLLLSDGYIGNGAEPWRIPDPDDIPAIEIVTPRANGSTFLPYERDSELARPWALPGTPGLEHRIGGLEKADRTGNISYDPANHEHMVRTRALKVENITHMIPPTQVSGPESGELLVIGWGGTYGAITAACERARANGLSVANVHLRHLNPLPADLGDIIQRYRRVLVPELNMGQLLLLLRARYAIDAVGFNKIQGKPFLVSEIEDAIDQTLRKEAASR
jgi:2-oxoglutarate ferredoxin oxidoreductase subunit alpha